jgi:hypothetical protein
MPQWPGLQVIGQALSCMTALRSLKLEGCFGSFVPEQVGMRSWQALLASLPAMRHLTALSLRGLPVHNAARPWYFHALSATLADLTALQNLDLTMCASDDPPSAAQQVLEPAEETSVSERLAAALGALTGLTHLTLGRFEHLLSLPAVFRHCHQLTALRSLDLIGLGSTQLPRGGGDDADGEIMVAFFSGLTCLTTACLHLDLPERHTVRLFAQALPGLSTLRSLRGSLTHGCYMGLMLLAEKMRLGALPGVQSIDCSQTPTESSDLNLHSGRPVFHI